MPSPAAYRSIIPTFASWATPTNRFTSFAVPTSAISSISSATSPAPRTLTLSKNYRSTKAILHAAGHLIANNKQRKPKDLNTDNADGTPVAVLTFETGLDEAEGIARRIRTAVTAGKNSYRDFAIFLRINALSRGLEAAFVKERVPYQIVKGLAFFERKENRDVLAYLRLLLNPRDGPVVLACGQRTSPRHRQGVAGASTYLC